MAHASLTHQTATLRAINYRISSTPTKELPHLAASIAASLWNCRDILSASLETVKSGNEAVTLVHRFRTTLTSLLQDRTIEGRWAAVVLVKSAFEAGGVEILSKSNTWVKSLLAILKKPDPPTTRILATITLTRIFVLTWDHANLVREITTPALSTLIASSLNNVDNPRGSTSELQNVLESFGTLISRHPTIFRTHESQIRALLLKILSSTSSHIKPDRHYTQNHRVVAQRLFVLLHVCAPKQSGAEMWDESLKATIPAAHATCDVVFRSVVETWKSKSGHQAANHSSKGFAGDPEIESDDALGLNSWSGIFNGCARLITLLEIAQAHVETATAGAVTVRIGLICDLLMRIFHITAPRSDQVESLKANIQIAKDEREAMFSILPTIHVSGLKLVVALLERFGAAIISVAQGLLESILDLFRAEMVDVELRTATYQAIETFLSLTGPSMTKEDVTELSLVAVACCNDLMPFHSKSMDESRKQANGALSSTTATPAGSITAAIGPSTTGDDLHEAAASLLPVLFSKVHPANMPRKARVQMERTAILTKHREALLACVLNPSKKDSGTAAQTSLLPLFASLYPDSAEVESLLRPRMPVLHTGSGPANTNVDEIEEDEEAAFQDDLDMVTTNGHDGNNNDDGNEPMDVLLSVLEQNQAKPSVRPDDEDLYSATPLSNNLDESSTFQAGSQVNPEVEPANSSKRPLQDEVEDEVSAKRLRASAVAETLQPEMSAPLPGADPASPQSSLPVTIAVEQPSATAGPLLHTATMVAGDKTAEAPASTSQMATANSPGGSDDSDFEIPPLNMDPDSDPEEDSGGEEGEE